MEKNARQKVTFISDWSYGSDIHYDIIDYLSTFLGPLGFSIKHSGYGNYEYWDPYDEGWVGGPGEYRWTYRELGDYPKPDVAVIYISDIIFVLLGGLTYIEFDYDKDGELKACINTEKTLTSKNAGKDHWTKLTGKFEKSWCNKEQFEKEFESWFREESMRLLKEESK